MLLDSEIRVRAAGHELTGWLSVEISRGIDQVPGTVTLALPAGSRPSAPAGRQWPMQLGTDIEVLVGNHPVLTGFVRRIAPRQDKDRTALVFAGAGLAADLVDSSAINSPGQWRDAPVRTVAADLCRPFGVAVRFRGDLGDDLRSFEIEQGETVFAALERLARMRSLLLRDDPDGALVLYRPDGWPRATTALVNARGAETNVLRSDVEWSLEDRYSEIRVRGQQQGSDDLFGRAAAAPSGRAEDREVSRYRPLVLVAESQVTVAQAQARAEWELVRRAGKSVRARMTVPAWRQTESGPLWDAGLLVPVRDVDAGLKRDMLVTAVAYRYRADGGRTAELTLEPPEAYAPKPQLLADAEAPGQQWGGLDRYLDREEG